MLYIDLVYELNVRLLISSAVTKLWQSIMAVAGSQRVGPTTLLLSRAVSWAQPPTPMHPVVADVHAAQLLQSGESFGQAEVDQAQAGQVGVGRTARPPHRKLLPERCRSRSRRL